MAKVHTYLVDGNQSTTSSGISKGLSGSGVLVCIIGSSLTRLMLQHPHHRFSIIASVALTWTIFLVRAVL